MQFIFSSIFQKFCIVQVLRLWLRTLTGQMSVHRYLLYIWYGPGKNAAANCSWPTYLRHWSIWKHLAVYFPVKLIKTTDLDPSKRYIFG